MTTLSPAAQAVWEAFNEDEAGVFVDYGDKLAVALRAAVDQLGYCRAPGELTANPIACQYTGAIYAPDKCFLF
jgi:hypothetical protein